MKIKRIALIVFMIMLIICGSAFCTVSAITFADETGAQIEENVPVTPDIDEIAPEPEENTESVESLADGFVEWLKSEYGEEYRQYYDLIIDKWGSIEAYLVQFGNENLTDEQNVEWHRFLTALGETSPVWAPALATVLLGITIFVGKAVMRKIVNRSAENNVQPIIDMQHVQAEESNKQSKALIALGNGVTVLLGTSDRYADVREQINASLKELADE